jgi:hypothetical protein
LRRSLNIAASFVFATATWGADSLYAQSPPASIPIGPIFVYPELELAVKRDSNIALQPAATRRADTIWYLRPAVRLEAKQGPSLYDTGYRGDYGRYQTQTTNNFENHELFANAFLTLDARNYLKLKGQYQDRVDPPGTLNIGATLIPSEWQQRSGSMLYSFGAQDAQGKIELEAGALNKRYVNNRFATAALDNVRRDYGGTFLLRVQPKTYATFTAKQSAYHYLQPGSTLNSKDTFYLVGARWDVTSATSGRFSVGRQTKRFENTGIAAGRTNFSGGAWEVGAYWKPLTYSTLDLKAQRRTNEFTGAGDFVVNQSYQLQWMHDWTSQLTSSLTGIRSDDRFRNAPVALAGGAQRHDVTKVGGLGISYKARRWLKFGAEYSYTTRDSNDANLGYQRRQLMLSVSATL